MKLDYLELGFENCEIARIPGKYINSFYVGKLETEYRRIAWNSFGELKMCHKFGVEISKDANEHMQVKLCGDNSDQKLFDRINAYPDITSIEFSIDGEKHFFWVDYNEESPNPPQKTYVSTHGHLYLAVGEGTRISDYVDMDEIDDPDYELFLYDETTEGSDDDT